MGMELGRLDYWRQYFSSCSSDIFGVIENAILVAKLDCPKEFLSRRDSIAEKLFAWRCAGCDGVELQVPCGEARGEEGLRGRRDGGGEEKAGDGGCAGGGQIMSNYSYDEAEALTEELEEEGQAVGEVFRIKELLTSKEYKSDSIVFESLRRLQLMGISVETLKATEIGKVINGLRKHNSKQIRQLARILIDEWKVMVEEWANSTAVLAEATPESADPSLAFDQWEGLPLPPLDEGALFATQTGTMELSQFFDGMEDDGSTGIFGANGIAHAEKAHSLENVDNRTRNQKKPAPRIPEDQHPTRNTQIDQPNSQNNQQRDHQPRGMDTVPQIQPKQSNGRNGDPASTFVRPPRPGNDHRVAQDVRQNHPSFVQVQKQPVASANEVCAKECTEDSLAREKLELAKRKLHEGYRQAETAKRQRTIQVMELHDLPKQTISNRQLFQKPVNSRYWASRRI